MNIYDGETEAIPVPPITPYALQSNAVRITPERPLPTPHMPEYEIQAYGDYTYSQQRLSRALVVVCVVLTISVMVIFVLLFWLLANIRFLQ